MRSWSINLSHQKTPVEEKYIYLGTVIAKIIFIVKIFATKRPWQRILNIGNFHDDKPSILKLEMETLFLADFVIGNNRLY